MKVQAPSTERHHPLKQIKIQEQSTSQSRTPNQSSNLGTSVKVDKQVPEALTSSPCILHRIHQHQRILLARYHLIHIALVAHPVLTVPTSRIMSVTVIRITVMAGPSIVSTVGRLINARC